MDVACERCGTEYEFDETLLSGRGTSVKCTNCGHVFKVYPKETPETDRQTSTWRLRLHTGASDAIDSLRELQRRISSGELTPDDEIARGDDEWKALGSIPELETFFQAAGFETPSGRQRPPLPPVTSRSMSDSPSLSNTRPHEATLLGVRSPVAETARGVEAPAAVSVTEPLEPHSELGGASSAAARSYRSPYTRDSMPQPYIEDAEFEEPLAAPPMRTSTPPPAYYDDDDDIPELPDRSRSPLKWLLLVVLVGAGALVATQWERVAQLLGLGSDPALVAAATNEGDAALAEGHPEAYAAAVAAYGRAIDAGATDDARLFANLSRAYALAAQAQVDADAEADIEAVAAAAMASAASATEIDRQGVATRLAYIDALRLAGSNREAREQLEEVRSVSFSRTPEFYRIDARLSAAEAGGRLEKGLRSARETVKLAPEGIPYLLLAARSELAAGNPVAARQRLDEVLVLAPGHPVAMSLIAPFEESEPAEASPEPEQDDETQKNDAPEAAAADPSEGDEATDDESAPPVEAAEEPDRPDATAPVEEPEPVETETRAAAAPTAPNSAPRPRTKSTPARKEADYDEYDRLARAAGADAFVDGRPPVLDYESNMAKGRSELAAGSYARARAYFDSALEVHPGSADAMDALGDVATAVSDYASAVRYYRVAAQRGRMDGYFKLGKTYEKLGKTEQAVSAYYTYITRRPRGPHAAEARNAITALEPRAKLPPEPEPSIAPDAADESPAAPSETTP